jgi:GNAT superfamily N-acetyltransferase
MSPENSPQINYLSPPEAMEQGDPPQHRFDLIIEGQRKGAAEINYYAKPLPLYQLTGLYVDFDEQGQGYASQLMDQVENFLQERKRPGVLVDAIQPGDPASSIYERRD